MREAAGTGGMSKMRQRELEKVFHQSAAPRRRSRCCLRESVMFRAAKQKCYVFRRRSFVQHSLHPLCMSCHCMLLKQPFLPAFSILYRAVIYNGSQKYAVSRRDAHEAPRRYSTPGSRRTLEIHKVCLKVIQKKRRRCPCAAQAQRRHVAPAKRARRFASQYV